MRLTISYTSTVLTMLMLTGKYTTPDSVGTTITYLWHTGKQA